MQATSQGAMYRVALHINIYRHCKQQVVVQPGTMLGVPSNVGLGGDRRGLQWGRVWRDMQGAPGQSQQPAEGSSRRLQLQLNLTCTWLVVCRALDEPCNGCKHQSPCASTCQLFTAGSCSLCFSSIGLQSLPQVSTLPSSPAHGTEPLCSRAAAPAIWQWTRRGAGELEWGGTKIQVCLGYYFP